MTAQRRDTTDHKGPVPQPPRRQKVQFHLWLDPETGSALRALAAARTMPASVLVESFIRAGLGQSAEERLEGPALPAVRRAVEDVLRPQTERLAALIVKTHLEAGIAERLVFVLVANALGPDRARQFLDTARTRSIEALKRPLGQERPIE